ncbi:MAG: ACP phosphodiesterase [Pseudomonadota bacterium]
MNYLAHAVLSGDDPAWILGGFLGDHVRGGRWRDYEPPVAAGILLHRRLDAWFDALPAVAALRPAFGSARRYAGILIDIGLDHVLARRWAAHGPAGTDVSGYAEDCSTLLYEHWDVLPDSLRRFARYDRSTAQLAAYDRPEGIDRALRGIDSRFRRATPLAAGWRVLAPQLERIETLFEETWPAAVEHADGLRQDMLARATAPRES